MHILMWTAAGLVLLAAFVVIAALVNKSRAGAPLDGAWIFIWVWFAAALANGYNGWAHHDIPLVNEIAAFVPVFGIPAGLAWFWSRRGRASSTVD